MKYGLFALTNDPANRIVRFSLSEEVKEELTLYLKMQEDQFNSNCETEIPFDGKYKPDSNEVLVIDNYDDLDNLSHAIRNPLSSTIEIVPTPKVFEGIKALFTGMLMKTIQ